MNVYLSHLFSEIKFLLMPSFCSLCANLTTNTLDLCSSCEIKLPWITNACSRCSTPLFHKNQNSIICGACINQPPSYNICIVPWKYQSPLENLLMGMKFFGKLSYAYLLGSLLARVLQTHYQNKQLPECIIPVPLHRYRIRERGYNQALELARPIAKTLHLPIDVKNCNRILATAAQTSLQKKQRITNVKNAFAIKPINYNHVAVIDDVITTGSTVHELCLALRKQGVSRIDVWCCARTMRPQ